LAAGALSAVGDEWMRAERVVLVGRERELTALRHLLDEGSLVTVIGPGGVGKTRLALAVADDIELPEAAVCELAGVGDPAQVAGVVCDALGFPSLQVALAGLAESERLLILDNCEHVLDAVAEVAGRLLEDCPGMSILATSREPLEVAGEQVLQLHPLALPATDDPAEIQTSPAVRLFLARAKAAGASGLLDGETAADVAKLCRRLDGLPLAIELAAARTRSLAPAEILGHLDRRLDVITSRRQRGLARHRSLEAAIGWSYDRLSPSMQRFFERLGAFAGPFSAAAAQAVAAEPTEDPRGGRRSARRPRRAITDRGTAAAGSHLVCPPRHRPCLRPDPVGRAGRPRGGPGSLGRLARRAGRRRVQANVPDRVAGRLDHHPCPGTGPA
jgi:predicted ATPase